MNLQNNNIIDDYSVDIIIIGKNEGDILEKAFESVKKASDIYTTKKQTIPRIIYVDGKSSDNSVELAASFGIETYIVSGKPTPPAGRKLGLCKGHGKYVFFLDGDMEVDESWLFHAVGFLEANENCAGVAGLLDWIYINNNKIVWEKKNYFNVVEDVEEVVGGVGGGMIFKRTALEQVGGWNVMLERSGELDLYLRLLSANYKLNYLKIPMVRHYDLKSSKPKNFIKRILINKNIFNQGQIARHTTKSYEVWRMLAKIYWLHILHPIIILLMLLSAIFYYGTKENIYIYIFFIIAVVFISAHLKYKSGDITRTIVSMATMNIYSPAFIAGFMKNLGKKKQEHHR